MNVDQPAADLAQGVHLYRNVVYIGSTFPSRRDDAPDDRPVFVVDVQRFEQCLQSVSVDVEFRLDDAVALAVLNRCGIGAVTENQAESPEQDRFSGSGLSGDDIQPGGQFDVQPVDQRVIFNRQTIQHGDFKSLSRRFIGIVERSVIRDGRFSAPRTLRFRRRCPRLLQFCFSARIRFRFRRGEVS